MLGAEVGLQPSAGESVALVEAILEAQRWRVRIAAPKPVGARVHLVDEE